MQLFQRLSVTSLPFVFILADTATADRERIKIKNDDQLKPDSYERFPWTSDELGSFLTERTGISVGKVRTAPQGIRNPEHLLQSMMFSTV